MKQQSRQAPKARKDKLLTQELHGELLIYDLETDKAHCLNQTAALIWKRCDGRTSISDLAQALDQELQVPIDEKVIKLALQQFSRDNLLAEKYEVLPLSVDLSRRTLVRRLGIAAVLLPLVTTISAPTALAGTSNCVAAGNACSAGGLPCCGVSICESGTCI